MLRFISSSSPLQLCTGLRTGWVLQGGAQLSRARSCGSVASTGCKEALSPLKVTQLASRAASTISHLFVVSQPHASTPCVPLCQCWR